jgi:hypothetical protein
MGDFFYQKIHPISLIKFDGFKQTGQILVFLEIIFFYVFGENFFESKKIQLFGNGKKSKRIFRSQSFKKKILMGLFMVNNFDN